MLSRCSKIVKINEGKNEITPEFKKCQEQLGLKRNFQKLPGKDIFTLFCFLRPQQNETTKPNEETGKQHRPQM